MYPGFEHGLQVQEGHSRDKDARGNNKGGHICESADFDSSYFFTTYINQVL